MSERYLHWFYILGLSVYNPRDSSGSSSRNCGCIRKSIPSICFLSITFLSSIVSFDIYSRKKVTLNDCLHAFYIIFMVTTGIMTFKRSSFLRGDTKYIWKHLIELDHLISSRLKLDIIFKKFHSIFMRKLLSIMFFFGCYVSFKVFHRMSAGKAIPQIGALTLILMTASVNVHNLFYIDLFNFIFRTINLHTLKCIEAAQSDTFIVDENFNERIVQLFQMLKLIHFKLWKINKLINSDLGWVITLLIIQNTYTAIQEIYWIIVELYVDDLTKNIRIFSMYSF